MITNGLCLLCFLTFSLLRFYCSARNISANSDLRFYFSLARNLLNAPIFYVDWQFFTVEFFTISSNIEFSCNK